MKQFSKQDSGIILTDETGLDWTANEFLGIFSSPPYPILNVPWVTTPSWSIQDTCPFSYYPVENKHLLMDDVYLLRCISTIRRDFILDDLIFPLTPLGIILLVKLNHKRPWENDTLNIRYKTGFYWVAKSNLPCVIGVLEAEPQVITIEKMIEIVKIPPRVPIIRDYGAMDKMKDQVTDEKLKFVNDCIRALLQIASAES